MGTHFLLSAIAIILYQIIKAGNTVEVLLCDQLCRYYNNLGLILYDMYTKIISISWQISRLGYKDDV